MTLKNGEAPVSPGDGDQRRYDLAGDGWQIQITSTRITWPIILPITLSLTYRGPDGGGTFSGDAIRSQTSEPGTLLTVTLPNNKDTLREEKVTLTVLLPDVQPTGSPEWTANIKTVAILTTTNVGTPGTSLTGQTQSYQVYELEGTLTFSLLPQRVTLNVDAASYHVGDPVSVTLSNQSAQSISFINLQSECSVIQLQRQEDGNWKEVNPCPKGRDPLGYHLDAGKDLTVRLVSSSGSAGLYRAALSYSASGATESRTVYSQEFQVIASPEGH